MRIWEGISLTRDVLVETKKYKLKASGRRLFVFSIIFFAAALAAIIASIYFGVMWSHDIIGLGFGLAAFLSLIGICLIVPARRRLKIEL